MATSQRKKHDCCKEDDEIYEIGEQWSDPGVCNLKVCRSADNILLYKCPQVELLEGCFLKQGDSMQSFPHCCPSAECPGGVQRFLENIREQAESSSSSSSSSEDEDQEDIYEEVEDDPEEPQYVSNYTSSGQEIFRVKNNEKFMVLDAEKALNIFRTAGRSLQTQNQAEPFQEIVNSQENAERTDKVIINENLNNVKNSDYNYINTEKEADNSMVILNNDMSDVINEKTDSIWLGKSADKVDTDLTDVVKIVDPAIEILTDFESKIEYVDTANSADQLNQDYQNNLNGTVSVDSSGFVNGPMTDVNNLDSNKELIDTVASEDVYQSSEVLKTAIGSEDTHDVLGKTDYTEKSSGTDVQVKPLNDDEDKQEFHSSENEAKNVFFGNENAESSLGFLSSTISGEVIYKTGSEEGVIYNPKDAEGFLINPQDKDILQSYPDESSAVVSNPDNVTELVTDSTNLEINIQSSGTVEEFNDQSTEPGFIAHTDQYISTTVEEVPPSIVHTDTTAHSVENAGELAKSHVQMEESHAIDQVNHLHSETEGRAEEVEHTNEGASSIAQHVDDVSNFDSTDGYIHIYKDANDLLQTTVRSSELYQETIETMSEDVEESVMKNESNEDTFYVQSTDGTQDIPQYTEGLAHSNDDIDLLTQANETAEGIMSTSMDAERVQTSEEAEEDSHTQVITEDTNLLEEPGGQDYTVQGSDPSGEYVNTTEEAEGGLQAGEEETEELFIQRSDDTQVVLHSTEDAETEDYFQNNNQESLV